MGKNGEGLVIVARNAAGDGSGGEENLLRSVLCDKLDLTTRLDYLESMDEWRYVFREYRRYLESFCR
ncbi:unnamed protein product [marine sediment metagenome]|uniref:Uncharacterized protein n=1 Tax=marine sediment metagenome TaxID=412755 RepID=X1LLZ8_9ZZZZ